MLASLLLFAVLADEPPKLSPRLVAFGDTCQRERGVAAAAFRRHLVDAKRGRQGWLVAIAGRDADERLERAAAVARAGGAELRRIALRKVIGKHHAETEANLARVFAAAEQDGVVLLFDEADALFRKRTDVKDAHDRYANQEVSYLRERLQALPDLVLVGITEPPPSPTPEQPPLLAVDALLLPRTQNPPDPVQPWTRLCWAGPR